MDDRLAEVLGAIRGAGAGELEGIERALEQRRRELGRLEKTGEAAAPSQVVEGRPYGDGWLQLESRTYERKDGGVSLRGPYWYFRYHEGGRQRKLYLGKTDDPEGALEEKLAARGARADEEKGRKRLPRTRRGSSRIRWEREE
jgi:hypothetical protein